MINGQLLFPTHILHALNAIQHLRAMHIISSAYDKVIYSTAEEIAKEIGAPVDVISRAMMHLSRAGIVESKTARYGGYYMKPEVILSTRVKDILAVLGKTLPENGNTRASDRLNNAVLDCLDLTLEDFLK